MVTATLGNLSKKDVPVDILSRIALLYPHLRDTDAAALASLLSADFGRHPKPLTAALVELPVSGAVALWESVARDVHLPLIRQERASAETSTAAAASGAAAAGAPAPAPSNSGVGAAMMRSLTEAVRARLDSEQLLAAIVASAQAEDTCESVRAWVLDDADSLIATLASPVHRTRHGLLGLLNYPLTNWTAWASYSRTVASTAPKEACLRWRRDLSLRSCSTPSRMLRPQTLRIFPPSRND